MHQRGRQIEAAGCERGVGGDQLAERVDGLGAVAALHQREPETVEGVRDTGIERRGAFEAGERAIQVAERLQRDPELKMCRGERRRQPHRFAQLDRGLGQAARLAQRGAEVVARLRMVRPKPDRRAQRRHRAVQVPGPPSGGAEVILRVEQRRIELDRPGELRERLGDPLLPAEHEPKLVVRDRAAGPCPDRAFVGRGRAGQIPAGLEQLAQQEHRIIARGTGGEDLLDRLHRGVQPARRRHLPRLPQSGRGGGRQSRLRRGPGPGQRHHHPHPENAATTHRWILALSSHQLPNRGFGLQAEGDSRKPCACAPERHMCWTIVFHFENLPLSHSFTVGYSVRCEPLVSKRHTSTKASVRDSSSKS